MPWLVCGGKSAVAGPQLQASSCRPRSVSLRLRICSCRSAAVEARQQASSPRPAAAGLQLLACACWSAAALACSCWLATVARPLAQAKLLAPGSSQAPLLFLLEAAPIQLPNNILVDWRAPPIFWRKRQPNHQTISGFAGACNPPKFRWNGWPGNGTGARSRNKTTQGAGWHGD